MFPPQLLLLLTTLFFCATHHALCDQLYDSTKEVCCDGTVYVIPLNETSGHSCCGSQLLLNGDGVCCNNTIIPYKHNVTGVYDAWGCCKSGDQVNLYNTETQRCCQGNIVDVGDNCKLQCCGITTYNFRKEMCCDNVVHDTGNYPSRYSCCGNTTFEYKKGLCCNNVIHITGNSNRYGCCGDQPYNIYTHLCCSLWPDTKLDTDDLFKRQPQTKLHPLPDYVGARFEHSCCGLDMIYNTKSKGCCNGVLHQLPSNSSYYQCCGTKLLNNTAKEICCPGDIVRATEHSNHFCCGEGLYDQEHEHCCGGHTISKSANVNCCWDLGTVYNPKTNVCCGDPLMPRPIDYDETFDTTLCCRKLSK